MTNESPSPTDALDVIIIGGGPAGLAAATALGRSRRRVLLVDSGTPRNAPAAAAHNVLSRDGIAPRELLRLGRAEAEGYGVHVIDGEVEEATGHDADGDGLVAVRLRDGTLLRARRLIVAAGAVDTLSDLPGLAERWGRDVLFCPYCHGWEVRDRRIGVLGSWAAAHQAQMFRQLSADVSVLLDGADPLPADDLERLSARGIALVPGRVTRLVVVDDALVGVELASGAVHPLDALVVLPSAGPRPFGLELADEPHPSGMGHRRVADPMGRSSAAGVWLAGSAADPMMQVMASAADGLKVGAAVNADLIEEEIRAAVASVRERV